MDWTARLERSPFRRLVAATMSIAILFGLGGFTALPTQAVTHNAAATSSCQLNSAQGNIKHVISIQFDNLHFSRDNPNIPSDLEQMPNLLNFIENNGVLLSNNHTPLIAHTATDILTTASAILIPMARATWACRLPTGPIRCLIQLQRRRATPTSTC